MMNTNKLSKAISFALLAGSIGFSATPFAAEGDADEEQKEEVERITVTGSNIKRTSIEGPSPITVITDEDMKANGFATAYDALSSLSQNTGTVQGNEFGSQGGFTPAADVISLRGFGPGYTLVLVNGRRIAENPTPYNGQSNFVNLNSIPFAAIDRIEVVADGASAIYGSDAVSGVINIILKDDIDDTTVSALYGTTKDGGGDEKRLQIVTGSVGERYSVSAALEYFKQDPIFGKDRDWLDSIDDGPAGVDYLTRGILELDRVAGVYRDPGEQKCLDSQSGYEYAFRSGSGYYCGFDATGDETIQNERETYSAYISGKYDLTDNHQLFTDIMYQKLENKLRGFRHFVSEDVVSFEADGSGNLDQWFGPGFEVYDYKLLQRIFAPNELGDKKSVYNEDVFNVTAGIRGSIFGDYEYEVAYTESRYDYESKRDWIKEEKAYEYFIGEGSVAFGLPDGAGKLGLYDPITADVAADMVGQQLIVADSYNRTANAKLTGDLFDLPAGAIQFAAILEYNRQGYTLTQDDRTLNDTGMGWYGLTGTQGGGDRSRYAGGLEFLVPIIDGLELNLAGRYDKYDDDTTEVGGRFTPQAKLTYRPIEEVMLRAGYSESFRAPDMHYVFAGDSGFFTSVRDYTKCRADYEAGGGTGFLPTPAFCDAETTQGSRSGSTELSEEKGRNYNVGIVIAPTQELDFTLDWYRINLKDIVGDESVQGLLDDQYECTYGGRDPSSGDCQIADSKITRVSGGPQDGELENVDISPINRSQYEQSGIDASMNYRHETEVGDLIFGVNYTHILSTKYQATAESDFEEIRDAYYNDEPRSKLNARIGYQYEKVALNLFMNRIGTTPMNTQPDENYDENGEITRVSRVAPYTTFNATATYFFTDNFSASLIGTNIFDERPPQDESQTSWPYYNIFAYPGAAVGAAYKAEVTYRF
ncbi:TonB-dependent receptor plug domain-containing protein [Paraferrimonas haliotis]|uniref:TonB-dependent receptor n=1 Tax=Paraferrimonas haliotis TaxID=2013866 RepID=A0AA37TYI5_9GAMM|nr:TonB-dependent receptor [Paraferrimonas haliotis]GLS83591.1 hypothetical protein GCM10007894_15680 [Paraferrimonas haliotis]